MKTVAVSGGFDPVHIGHLRLFNNAKKHGDKLIVILNNDNWIKAKKGYVFMKEDDRKEILEAFGCVDEVILSYHDEHPKDMSICAELEVIRPDVFCNGGDRKCDNIPECKLCKDLGIKLIFGAGGRKLRSSSTMVERYQKS